MITKNNYIEYTNDKEIMKGRKDMLEKAETYEEAKIIIQNSPKQEMSQYNKRIMKLQIKLLALATSIAMVAFPLCTKDIYSLAAVIPIGGINTLLSMANYLSYLNNLKKIENGEYFNDKSEEEIIKTANEYVGHYNEYMLEEGRKKR